MPEEDTQHEAERRSLEPEHSAPSEDARSVAAPSEAVPIQRRRLWRGLGRWVVRGVVFLVFVVLLAVVGTQLPVVRGLIIDEVEGVVADNLNGTLTIGGIRGTIWSGVVLDSVELRLQTGTAYDSSVLFHADHILASYSLLEYLRTGGIRVQDLTLVRPRVQLAKFSGDTTWNLSRLFKPSRSTDTVSAPFATTVRVEHLAVLGGMLERSDYNEPIEHTTSTGVHAIPWPNVDVRELDLDGSVVAYGEASQLVKLKHVSLRELYSGFELTHLQLDLDRDSGAVRVEHGELVSGRSAVAFAVGLTSPRIIETGELSSLKHSPVTVRLSSPSVSTYELRQFLPKPLWFLNGNPAVQLVASGAFGNLHIDTLGVGFADGGKLRAVGMVRHLDAPSQLSMDIALRGSGLSNRTVRDYVPGLPIPDLTRYGTIDLAHIEYHGEPLNFRAIFDASSTGAGAATGTVQMDLRRAAMVYQAKVATRDFNLAAVTNDDRYRSRINAETEAAGVGTNWRTLNATVQLRTLGRSEYGAYEIDSVRLNAKMDRGVANVSEFVAELANGPSANIASGTIDLANPNLPFVASGGIRHLKLAMLIPSLGLNPARVEMSGDLRGDARDVSTLAGTVQAKLTNLELEGKPLQDVDVNVAMEKRGIDSSHLSIASPVLDLAIDDRFSLRDLTDVLPARLHVLTTAISHRAFAVGTTKSSQAERALDSVQLAYHLRLKDLRPLGAFLPHTFLLATGDVAGVVHGGPASELGFTANADSLGFILRDRDDAEQAVALARSAQDTAHGLAVADSLGAQTAVDTLHALLSLPHFGSGIPRLHVTPTSFHLAVEHLSADTSAVLSQLQASLLIKNDSVIRLGSALLYAPHSQLFYSERALQFDVSTIYNDLLGVHLQGTTTFPHGDMAIALDTMRIVYFNRTPNALLQEYAWWNEGVAHVLIPARGGVALDTLTLIHPTMKGFDYQNAFAQRISLGGSLLSDTLDAWIHVPSFDLKEIPKLFPFRPNAKTLRLTQFDGTVRKLDIRATGLLERPELSADVQVNNVRYDGLLFDSARATLSYMNQALRGDVLIHADPTNFRIGDASLSDKLDSNTVHSFHAVIDSIPMLFAFKRGATYRADSLRVLQAPLSARLDAVRFPIDIATPFVPAFTELHGIADIHFGIGGTREKIEYGGYATIPDGSFLFAPNNMYYTFNGKLSFEKNSLVLSDIALQNIPSDDPNGAAEVNGHFDFTGFDITYFDLALKTDRLMVLSNASRSVLKMIYGPVTISTEGQALHFQNTLDAPWIGGPDNSTGKVDILDARLTLPQQEAVPQTVETQGVVYRWLPSDSMLAARAADSAHVEAARKLLRETLGSGSLRQSLVDDTLFSNRMKDIYLTDAGQVQDSAAATRAAKSIVRGGSFADRLRCDLQIRVGGDAWVQMPFSGVFGVLGAEVNAELRTNEPILVHRGNDLQTIVTGDLGLTENSTFRFYQTFTVTSGKISFQQNFFNPSLDIVAAYTGPHYTSTGEEEIKIQLGVTGTKELPKLAATIFKRQEGTGSYAVEEEGNMAQEDVIYYLISGGYFKSDLSEAGQVQVLQKAASTIGSQLFSSMLSNMFGSSATTSFIRSASLQLGSSVGLQLTAGWRNITLHYSAASALGDPLRADYVIDVPVNTLSNLPWSRNLNLQFQIHNNPSLSTPGSPAEQPTFLSKLLYQIPLF